MTVLPTSLWMTIEILWFKKQRPYKILWKQHIIEMECQTGKYFSSYRKFLILWKLFIFWFHSLKYTPIQLQLRCPIFISKDRYPWFENCFIYSGVPLKLDARVTRFTFSAAISKSNGMEWNERAPLSFEPVLTHCGWSFSNFDCCVFLKLLWAAENVNLVTRASNFKGTPLYIGKKSRN